MGTVSKEIADNVVARNGYYEDDPRVLRIIEYTNFAGDKAYGLEYSYNIGIYVASPYVINPKVYWEAE